MEEKSWLQEPGSRPNKGGGGGRLVSEQQGKRSLKCLSDHVCAAAIPSEERESAGPDLSVSLDLI